MENSAFSYQKEKSFSSIIAGFFFSHIGLFLLVAGYCVFGAWVFVELEKGAELSRKMEKEQVGRDIIDLIGVTTQKLWAYGDPNQFNWTEDAFIAKVKRDLDRVEKYVIVSVHEHKYDGYIDTWDYDWTFFNSILLTLSIVTTIGYGHIAPKTFEGQTFCIIYAMIGCPLFLVFLANIGDAMAKGFINLYSRGCCRAIRSRRYLEEVPEGSSKKYRKLVGDDIVGEETYMPTSKMFVPITLSIVLLHGFFIVGGIVFAYWEDWDLWSGFYFSFITLSTIGYGDLVPGNAFVEEATLTSTLKMIFSVTYIALGMALLSMCINLMQEQIIIKVRWASQRLGMSSSNKDAVEPASEALQKDNNALNPQMDPKKRKASPYRRGSTPYDPYPRPPEEKLPGLL